MNSTKMRSLLSKHPKNRKNLKSVKEITLDLMLYLKRNKKDHWPDEFLRFLSTVNKYSCDLDESFCLLSDPRELLSNLLITEVFPLSHSQKQQVFNFTCCGTRAHDFSCEEFWRDFLFILQEFILTSTLHCIEFDCELMFSE